MNTRHLPRPPFINNVRGDLRNPNLVICSANIFKVISPGILVMDNIINADIALDRTAESRYILATKHRLGEGESGVCTNYPGRNVGLDQYVL